MDRRRKQKALKPVSCNSVSVTRYQLGDGSTMISWRDAAGKRRQRRFASAQKAKDEAETIARDLNNGGAEAAIFSAADRASYASAARDVAQLGLPVHVATAEYAQAHRTVAPFGLGVSMATAEYAELRKLAGGRPLAELLRAGLQSLTRTPHFLRDIYLEVLASKGGQGGGENSRRLHGRYLRGLRTTGQKLAAFFPETDIAAVTAKDIESFLTSFKVGSRRRDNILGEVRHIFRFAWFRKYLPDEITAARIVPMFRELGGPITYYTPDEMRLFVRYVAAEWEPYLWLAGFAAIRPEELVAENKDRRKTKDPLRWEDFQWDQEHEGLPKHDPEIVVRPETSKTGHKRQVPIAPNLYRALKRYRDARLSGPVAPQKGLYDELGRNGRLLRVINTDIRAQVVDGHFPGFEPEAGGRDAVRGAWPKDLPLVKWHDDGLRHSYATYRQAVIRNLDQLSDEMGNSPAIIRKHYDGKASRAQGADFFSILPPALPSNVIELDLRIA